MKLTPAASERSTNAVAAGRSRVPTTFQKPRPAKVMVPRHSSETSIPVRPSGRYCMQTPGQWHGQGRAANDRTNSDCTTSRPGGVSLPPVTTAAPAAAPEAVPWREMTNRANAGTSEATMAVFLDLENIALGARDASYPSFDVEKVLERLLLKGHIVVKKAYCDFDRYKEFKRGLHEAAFELIEIPHVRQSGKNSADIRMVVDALDLCYTKGHVDTFVILSGDSDFSPLVSKLRENAKTVIGVGVKNSTSDLFINNCDEFIYYDDLVRKQPSKTRRRSAMPAPAQSPAASAAPPA